jgi:Fic family protein
MNKPAKQPAKKGRDIMKPVMPYGKYLGPLKDLAQEVIMASTSLEGRVAPQTAMVLGDKLRLLNSFYSNLIEGHKTFIPDIEKALANDFSENAQERYAQELCSAHVRAERALMKLVLDGDIENVSAPAFLKQIHGEFYSHLPPEHQFTHEAGGFTDIEVRPGQFRDLEVAVHLDAGTHGPNHKDLHQEIDQFSTDYDSRQVHGDERLIAMAAAHHQLTWLHPFHDGNGRVCRLHSGLFMARAGINKGNLWSLSRGLSRAKTEYMMNLFSVDPAPNDTPEDLNERLADFCEFFLEVCFDQINFIKKQLRLEKIESRIEWFVSERSTKNEMPQSSSRLLRALFMQGNVKRGEVPSILNTSETTSRRIVRKLTDLGLVTSTSHRAPLTVGLPTYALAYYFPSLYIPELLGSKFIETIAKTVTGSE